SVFFFMVLVGSKRSFQTGGAKAPPCQPALLHFLNSNGKKFPSTSGTNQLVFLGANNTANYTIGTLTVGTNGVVVIANGIAAGEQRAINVGSLNGTAAGIVRGANGGATAATATLNLTGTSAGSYSGQILDGAAITRVVKSGTATQTLSNNNTYTGGTVISAGTLVVAANNAIGAASGAVAISGASQATLQINSDFSVGNNITFSNTNAGSSVSRLVANGTAYTVGTTGNFTSSFAGGDPDTTAKILAGTNTQGSTATLAMKFSDTSAATNDGMRVSDVFSLNGTATNTFVLQLNVTGIAADNFIGWLNGGVWVNAVSGNTGNNASLAQQGYLGSFSAFQSSYGTTLSGYVGAYGVDTTTGSVWSVLNHNSDFAVVPEPSTWVLLAGGLTFVMVLRRRRHT
ncbi:MAG: PEP-CTERM sorting domain-containing protein, partial [Verrucomicrobiaceae bacterium]